MVLGSCREYRKKPHLPLSLLGMEEESTALNIITNGERTALRIISTPHSLLLLEFSRSATPTCDAGCWKNRDQEDITLEKVVPGKNTLVLLL